MAKKFVRIALVAFVLCAALAITSFAYSTDVFGRVSGLEAGVDYTVAQYDFAANAYGEFTELTKDTSLTAGIWGIKAGDAEPEALFVAGSDSGYLNFFSNETGLQMNDIFAGKNDDYVPGKWTISTDGAYVSVSRYVSTQEILMTVFKGCYQTQTDVQKTVMVDEVKYPVFLIDEAEYYLKDEAYYAVKDNALYEGEGEAAPAMVKSWINCQPIIGEENRLQESVLRYGFTNAQVIPAKDVIKFAAEGTTSKTGAMFYHTNEDGYTYTDADLKGTFTFVVKNIGSEEETRYVIDTVKATKVFEAPAEMAESDGYLVAIEYAPYANCEDDIFHGHPTDEAGNCYAYLNLYAGRNAVDFTVKLPAAPEVKDGQGLIWVEPTDYYIEIAPVTINKDGTGLAYGEWTDYEYNVTNKRDMLGLYAVRGYNGSIKTEITYAWAYAEFDGRKTLGSIDPATTRVATKTGGFIPGYWSNTKWASGSNLATHSTFGGAWVLGTTGGQVSGGYTTTLKNALANLAALKAAETPDADAIAEAEAALLAAQKTVANEWNTANYTYGYLPEDIIRVEDATSFYYDYFQNNSNVVFTTARVKLIAYVADRNGNVTPYSSIQEHAYAGGGTHVKGTFNFQDFLPEEGWLIGLQIYPCTDIAPAELTAVNGTGNGRMLLSVAQENYKVTDMESTLTPVADEKPEGLYTEKGAVKGFDPDKNYAWAPFHLMGNKIAEWTPLPEGITEYDFDRAGAIAIAYAGDGYETSHSEPTYVAFAGSDNDIYNRVTKNGSHRTTEVEGTKYKLYTIDGVEYYLKSEKYYAVADNTEYTGTNSANAKPVYISTKDVIATFSLENNTDNLYNVKFNEGLWSGIVLTNTLALDYSFDALTLGTTSTPISSGLATALDTADKSGDADKIATARKNAANKANNIYYSYAFTPDEVIKMADFESLDFAAKYRQGGFKLNGSVETKIIFKVIDENGNLVDRVVYKPATFKNSGAKATVYASDFNDLSGHIVGMVFYPYVLTEGSYYSYSGKVNGDYDIMFYADGYKVNRTLDPADQPEGIKFEGNKITGLDEDETYYYGAYTVAGKLGEWTEVTGVTEVTHDITSGLVGISIEGDGLWTSESKPVVSYVEGAASARADIGNVVDSKPVYDSSKVDAWKVGIWSGDYLSWHDQTANAYSFLDQSCGVGPTQAETLWLYQNDRATVEARLAEDAKKEIPAHWVTNKVTSNPARLQAVINTHYAPEDYAETLPAKKLALQTKVADALATRNIKYAFDETEIIPVDELLTMAFTSKKRQGGFTFSSVRSKVVIHVMDENANVTPYEWFSETWGVSSSGSWKKISVDVQSIEGLPEEGWVVGIEFYPWADIEPSSIMAITESRIDASSIAYSFGQQHVCIGYYPADYTVFIAPPVVEYDQETGIVSGLDANRSYVYGPYTVNKLGATTAVAAGSTTLQLTDGLWGICSVDSGSVSNPTLVYYRSDRTTMEEIGTIIDHGTYQSYDINDKIEDNWAEGKWSGLHIGVHSSFGTYVLGSIGGHIWSEGAKLLYKAQNDIDKAAAIAHILNDANAVKFRYAYASDEIIEARDLLGLGFKTTRRMGSLTLGQATAKVTFYVLDENRKINEYVWTSDRYNAQAGGTFNVVTSSIENWPEKGWVVGLEIRPWQDLDPDALVSNVTIVDGKEAFYSTMCNMTFIPADYAIVSGDEVTDTPELELTSNNNIKITNYNKVLTYAYSTDGGESWTEFTGATLVATKANTEYQIKSLESYPYEESAVATVTSRPVAVVGSTLILDGRIGTRVYLDIDEELVDPSTLILYSTKINSDYVGVEGMSSAHRIHGNSTQKLDWLSALGYDEEKDLYFFTVYVPVKDADNTSFETELQYTVTGGSVFKHGSLGTNLKVSSYVDEAKALAAAGNEDFIAALDVIENLENYADYADNYFKKGDAEAYASTASTEGITAPTRTNATLEGVTFYGTSLILEDQVTIRHYFAVNDIDAFNAAYNAGTYGKKGNFIYFDIADIPAQEIGDTKTLTIADKEDNVVYEVNYSVANYIVNMMDDDDANLVSLVNAMYDYYLAAADYAK